MKKIIKCTCYVLVLISILTACTNKDEIEAKLRKDESENASSIIKDSILDKNYERFDLLMERYINDTKVYGISVSNGIYDKVQVQIAGQSKDFEWSSLADDNYLPTIYYADVNDDDINECIIILTDDLSDKYISQKCHVLNPETLDEIEIENPSSYLDSEIKYEETDDGINVLLKEEIIYQIKKVEQTEEIQEEKEYKLNYNDLITYKVSSDELYFNVQFKYDNEIVDERNILYKFDVDKLIIE